MANITGRFDDLSNVSGGAAIPLRFVDNGDGTYSLATSGAAGSTAIAPNVQLLTGSAAALNADIISAMDASGYTWAIVQLTGTWSGTVQLQVSNDNSTFVNEFVGQNVASGAASLSMTANGMYVMPVRGKYLRLRATAYSSGTINGTVELSTVMPPSFYSHIISANTLTVAMNAFGAAAGDTALRTPTTFKTVSLGAATAETTIWTPTTGKKFRLMGFLLTCGAASTLTFKDNTAGTTIFVARGTTDTPIAPAGMGNGILSTAANNVLTVTRGTSCTLDGVVWGTEE